MKFESLQISFNQPGVATLTMDRPEVRNAFDDNAIQDLNDALTLLAQREDIRVLVLTGAGHVFSSGADLNWMRNSVDYDEQTNYEDALKLGLALKRLDAFPKPVVARVNGPAFGGAVGLISCCDVAVAVDSALFALTEVRIGLIPAVISPYVLSAMPPRQARRYFLSGERFNAQEALHMGLVHAVTSPDMIDPWIENIVEKLLQGGPTAQRNCKELIAAAPTKDRETLLEETAKLIAQARVSDEGQDGLNAFFSKRKPRWIP